MSKLGTALGVIGGYVAKLLWSEAKRRLASLTDEQLRSIARGVVGAGTRPLARIIADARAYARSLGVELSDDLDDRLIAAIGEELARVRIPGMLDKLAEDAERVLRTIDEARARGWSAAVKPDPEDVTIVPPDEPDNSED